MMPRSYPPGFGDALRDAWETHMASSPGRRELRFKPQVMKPLSLRAQFDRLPLDDCWEEARLWEPMAYLMQSKLLRRGWYNKI